MSPDVGQVYPNKNKSKKMRFHMYNTHDFCPLGKDIVSNSNGGIIVQILQFEKKMKKYNLISCNFLVIYRIIFSENYTRLQWVCGFL